jgi:hypothetical protein
VTTKGSGSRFQKTESGKFATTGAAGKGEAAAKPAPAPKTTKPKVAKSSKKQANGKDAVAQPAVEGAIPDVTLGAGPG